MTEANLTFAKIVANPNAFSWSQVYSAGKLFAVLSLETTEETHEKDYLNVLGKEILDTLEQEFFTLETKDLESIKQAVTATSSKIPQEINCSFVVGSVVNNVLYIYILGNGRASLKREEKLGNLLEVKDQKPDALKVVSGFLQDNDIIVLQTKQFADVISVGTLTEFMDNLPIAEAAENLAPLVHEKEEAGAAAILINYKSPTTEMLEEIPQEPETKTSQVVETEETNIQEAPFYTPQINANRNFLAGIGGSISALIQKLRLPNSSNLSLNHSRKVILTIVIIIIVVFIGSVMFAINKQQSEKTASIFQSIYPQAQKKYSEGQSLLELNQNLAHDSFSQAQTILESGKDKLPKNSKEEKQVLTLLNRVDSALNQTSGVTQSQAKQIDTNSSQLLLAETKNSGLYFTEDDSHIYGLTTNEIFSLNTDGTGKKTLIKNDNDWEKPGGLSTYFGNIYILDKKQSQILKYAQTDSGFAKANYFSSTTPDLSKTVSITIDSSIYVLSSDGNVAKFTKGAADNFSLQGLDKPLLNPTAILTNASDTYIYILDNGNSRIVVFDKNGNYKNQYQAGIIKNAQDFEVLEKDQKMYVLSGGKVYEIDLK